MSRDLLDLVRELNTLNDDNLADRVIANSDVQWCLSELQDILEETPTLTPPNEWVSVEEKTPKGNASILIYENGDIAIATFKDEKFMEYSDTGYPVLIRRPTHWTPLPEPPKEGAK